MHSVRQNNESVVTILSSHLVYLFAQLVRDFCLLGLHELPHHGEYVLPALRSRVGRVEVV